MRVHAGIWQEFDGFQTVHDHNWVRLMKFLRQIAKERQSSHLRAMALHILQSPSRICGMSVIHAKRRLNQRMRPTDTSIQERNVASIGVIRIGGPA